MHINYQSNFIFIFADSKELLNQKKSCLCSFLFTKISAIRRRQDKSIGIGSPEISGRRKKIVLK